MGVKVYISGISGNKEVNDSGTLLCSVYVTLLHLTGEETPATGPDDRSTCK